MSHQADLVVLGIGPGALCMVSRTLLSDLHPQSLCVYLCVFMFRMHLCEHSCECSSEAKGIQYPGVGGTVGWGPAGMVLCKGSRCS